MARTLYGLLVGIDDYAPPVPALGGCANDIRAFESLLKERSNTEALTLNLKVLLNQQATRQAVIDGFLSHLSAATESDVALFYYSGHGSQERTPPEFWYLEPDRLDETLVCYDSRTPQNYDLADKELARLIAQVAKSGAHVVILLDCCHSGSGTRAPESYSDVKVRRAPTDTRTRPVETFLTIPGDKEIAPEASRLEPRGRHILMAACRDDEEAKETTGDGTPRGAFSFAITQTLQNTAADTSYRDLFQRVNALVRARAARQSPVIEAVETADLDRPFLGGVIQAHEPYFTVHFDKANGWVINGGAVHGIPAPVGNETTVLALFPITSNMGESQSLKEQIGEARVSRRMPASATVAVTLNLGQPDQSMTYKATIVSLPLAALGVKITGDAETAELVRREIATCGPGGAPSLLVAESNDNPELRVIALPGRFRIMRGADDRPLAIDIDDVTADGARKVVERLEHIARWVRIVELRNPSTRLLANSIALELFYISPTGEEQLVDPTVDAAKLRFSYKTEEAESVPPNFKIRIANHSTRLLYCMLLDLPETFAVFSGLLEGNGAWLAPGEEAWAMVNGNPIIRATIPDPLLQQGVTELKDTLKVVASTEECDATLLDQDDLDIKLVVDRDSRSRSVPSNTLQRLMRRVQSRNFAGGPSSSDALADWTTSALTVTIVCPQSQVAVPAEGQSVELAAGVSLMGHGGFRAMARLSTELTASRDADLPPLPPTPPWLLDDPDVVRPLQFTASRAGEPGLSVLELDEVGDVSAVTAGSPLTLRADTILVEGEMVLPYGYDGEFYLPLGWATQADGATEINLVRLPAPLINKRSLGGSIRIFFKKVTSKYLGLEYEYPLLAAVEKAEDGQLRYIADKSELSSRVRAAERILLYIHGIIGDTRAMTASAFHPGLLAVAQSQLMSEKYDLILAFDYENLNTPIEQTARDLKHRLADAGLGAGHGKQLDVAAHSMGGLVARWFIEREGGNKVVNHLAMLGTPNGGSPWPVFEDWVATLIGIGLNGLGKIAWPPTVLGNLMHLLTSAGTTAISQAGKVQVALNEMSPKSDFLKTLSESDDPGISYSLIAGNTSLIPEVLETANGQTSQLQRLLNRLSPSEVLHRTTALAFFGSPNDIAVSVEAIESVRGPRTPEPMTREVASDHISYFSTDVGLQALAELAGAKRPRDLNSPRPQ